MEKHLLERLNDATDSCISCGFCESVCPTLPASDYNPSYGARGRVLIGRALYTDLKKSGRTEIKVNDAFYSCLDCFACVQVCPAGVNAGEVSDIVKEIITSRGSPLSDQEMQVARMIVNATMKYGNPLGLRKRSASWARGLEFQETSSTMLYTGNMYQLMAYSGPMASMRSKVGGSLVETLARRVKSYPALLKLSAMFRDAETGREMEGALKSIYRMLKNAGLGFSYMGDEEPYPGTFLYDLGYMEEFATYARKVTDLFHSKGVKRIITVDPHTHNVLKENYPKFVGDFDFEVVFYLDLIEAGASGGSMEDVTYHEPCYFTLRGRQYTRPEELLSSIASVHKPRRSGKSDFCCGGPAELLYPELAHSVSSERKKQLSGTGGSTVITACPICYANLSGGGKVRDISSYIESKSAQR